jgi:hypothetical protein
MTTKVPNTLFGLESKRGRLGLVIEASGRSQALRRMRWLAAATPFVRQLLQTGTVTRLHPDVPVPTSVPYVSSRTFEEDDVD